MTEVIIKEGYLQKKNEHKSYFASYSKRYFTLSATQLCYFSKEGGELRVRVTPSMLTARFSVVQELTGLYLRGWCLWYPSRA